MSLAYGLLTTCGNVYHGRWLRTPGKQGPQRCPCRIGNARTECHPIQVLCTHDLLQEKWGPIL